jgi:Na+-driven multidrug efflux pump
MAYNEVVVALLDEPKAIFSLRRFALVLAVSTTGLLILFKVTPLSEFWFGTLSALPENLLLLASGSLWLALLLPGLNVLQSWFQGILVNRRKTRGVTEAVICFVLISGCILWLGVQLSSIPGIYVGWIAFTSGSLIQTFWLWLRSRKLVRELERQPIPTQAFASN